MKRVIIIGADGFIGSHLTKALSSKGIEIWGIVLPQSPMIDRIYGIQGVHIVERSLESLDSSLVPDDADALYHLAWEGVAPERRDDFDLQFRNLKYSLSCVRFAANKKAKKIILPGSTAEYLFNERPIDALSIPSINTAYGSVKVAVRYLCAQLAKQLGIDFIYAVITGIYAADRNDSNVIYYTISSLLRGERPSLTGLEQKWDYVHIDDVIRALTLIGEKGKGGKLYAVGHGDNQPLRRYIDTISNLIDPSLPLGIGDIPYPNGRLPSSCVNLTELKKDTGYVPQVSFDKGILDVIEKMRTEKTYIHGNRESR
jgi:nucleoside-diphosphate-sugar epimerase